MRAQPSPVFVFSGSYEGQDVIGLAKVKQTILAILDAVFDDSFECHVMRMAAECGVDLEVFRCEGAWIWDPYGSLMRSVLVRAHQLCTLRGIWVAGCMTEESTLNLSEAHGYGGREHEFSAAFYLLKHVFRVDPAVWLQGPGDRRTRVQQTVRLLREHPLRPQGISIDGFVFRPSLSTWETVTPEGDIS